MLLILLTVMLHLEHANVDVCLQLLAVVAHAQNLMIPSFK